ncbi:DUF2203 domain-containing protein [Cohnella nanjingensis]|uniref:DUF2203 domain-containing protein n=1 Tax=Cohnella nanjingensis TaxID=1387779 RepID=A0A7X0RPZ1_9BACL|nr:DUF2203 domain-containing protein [Cohnella nanjingensis]MBB6671562.1 DUF2203 domain-containing protein [Cohnella nanjingensis]
MTTRIFTPGEADAMLPELNEDLNRLQTLMRQFEERCRDLQSRKAAYAPPAGQSAGGDDPFFVEEGQLDFMRVEADLLIANFARKGVLLKMIEPGLIDFPAIVDGQDALICWRQGETRVTHYHGWHDGYQNRKPLPEA